MDRATVMHADCSVHIYIDFLNRLCVCVCLCACVCVCVWVELEVGLRFEWHMLIMKHAYRVHVAISDLFQNQTLSGNEVQTTLFG